MEELFFSNIGKKIKTVAKVTAYIEMISAMLSAVYMLFAGIADIEHWWYMIFLAPLVAASGILLAWLSAILLYGFGELIETNSEIRDKTTYLVRTHMEDKKKGKEMAPPAASHVGTAPAYVPTPTYTPGPSYGRFDAPVPATPLSPPAPATPLSPPAPATPLSPAAPMAHRDPLAEKLSFALRYQTDEGMIHYLEQFQDERIRQILRNPKERIREIVQRVLDNM